ncbi:MAG: FkbM family methyltransferase [Dysgonamonadaceae bacterium]|jgi:FkbM family methyltransferase|nr:FkbM family methyltransferase [Dysgonamonadaceae bacterium]
MKKSLLEQLKDESNKTYAYQQYLKTSKLPLLLFSENDVSTNLIKNFLLDKNKLKVDHIVASKNYQTPDTSLVPQACGTSRWNKQVEQINEVLAKYKEVNLIFAFFINSLNDTQDLYEELSQNPKIINCFAFEYSCLEFDFPDYHEELKKHSSEIEEFYSQLEDDLSRRTLVEFINTKISGSQGKFFRLTRGEQYFPSFLHLSDQEVFVDCGAYDGDTIISFLKHTDGKYKKIYAFEPDENNIKKLRENVSCYNNVAIIEKGCFSREDILHFKSGDGLSSSIDIDGDVTIEVESIDNIIKDDCTYIKMDIEGSELEALKGAEKTIIANAPKIAVAMYHRSNTFYTIPKYIKSLNPKYRFWIRHYSPLYAYETVLYAICDEKG